MDENFSCEDCGVTSPFVEWKADTGKVVCNNCEWRSTLASQASPFAQFLSSQYSYDPFRNPCKVVACLDRAGVTGACLFHACRSRSCLKTKEPSASFCPDHSCDLPGCQDEGVDMGQNVDGIHVRLCEMHQLGVHQEEEPMPDAIEEDTAISVIGQETHICYVCHHHHTSTLETYDQWKLCHDCIENVRHVRAIALAFPEHERTSVIDQSLSQLTDNENLVVRAKHILKV